MANAQTASAHDPSFGDEMSAMDVVDLERANQRLVQFELDDTERRKALIYRLRKRYASQGTEVSEDVLEKAIQKMNEDRFVHKSGLVGLGALVAKGYVRRARYARNTALAAATVAVLWGGGSYANYKLFVEPKLAAHERLETQIGTVLPRQLAAAVENAMHFSGMLDDPASNARIESERANVMAALAIRNVAEAERGISTIRTIGDELRHRQQAAVLVKQADAVVAPMLAAVTDPAARARLSAEGDRVKSAAIKGDQTGYDLTVKNLQSVYDFILTPYTVTIVDRKDPSTGKFLSAGFERTEDRTGAKLWYYVVELIGPDGKAAPYTFKDNESGRTVTRSSFATRVSRAAFLALKADRADNTIIDNNIAGSKPKGKVDIQWTIDRVGDQMNANF
jgi:hypothetical protein